MLAAAGLEELPAVPSYWSSPDHRRVGAGWLAVGLVVLLIAIVNAMKTKTAPDHPSGLAMAGMPGPAGQAALAEVTQSALPSSHRSAMAAIDRAASERSRAPSQSAAPLRRAGAVGSFGKRPRA